MSDNKFRRKSFIATLGALALGWMGARGATRPEKPARERAANIPEGRVKKAPKAVPCANRTL